MGFNPTKGVPPLAANVLGTLVEGECNWFAECHNPADKDVEHPTVGWVPTCDDHIAWLMEDAT